eukprot:12936041-Prorocentrum_lima.AAC.1
MGSENSASKSRTTSVSSGPVALALGLAMATVRGEGEGIVWDTELTGEPRPRRVAARRMAVGLAVGTGEEA